MRSTEVSPSTSDTTSSQYDNVHELLVFANSLLDATPDTVLSKLCSIPTSSVADYFSKTLAAHVNSLPVPFVSTVKHITGIRQDMNVTNNCHPLLLESFRPIQTTADGNCMFNALSLSLTATEKLSILIRLPCAFALTKHKQQMLSAFFPSWIEAQAQLTLWY